MNNLLQNIIEDRLSGVQWTERDRKTVLDKISAGRKPAIIRKQVFAFALAAALVLTLTSALAYTVYGLISAQMEPAVSADVFRAFAAWDTQDKLRFIDMMKRLDVPMDEEKLSRLENATGEEQDTLAYELIDGTYGEILDSLRPEYVDISPENPIPAYEAIFTELWLRESPDSSSEEIASAYREWESTVLAQAEAALEENIETAPVSAALTQEEVILRGQSILSEVWSLGASEIESCSISAAYHEQCEAWELQITIPVDGLRVSVCASLNEKLGEQDTQYQINLILTGDGSITGASSWIEYEYSQVIPRSAYPDDADNIKGFQSMTPEQKAAFSAEWKPVLDAWLQAHTDYADTLAHTKGEYDVDYILTRHIYGVPEETAIVQDEAIEIAKSRYLEDMESGVTREMLDERCKITYLYDITDPDHPLWKVTMTARLEPEYYSEEDHKGGYHVIIDAKTGAVLDAYTLTNESGTLLDADQLADRFY